MRDRSRRLAFRHKANLNFNGESHCREVGVVGADTVAHSKLNEWRNESLIELGGKKSIANNGAISQLDRSLRGKGAIQRVAEPLKNILHVAID
jgi:hypothetical protein